MQSIQFFLLQAKRKTFAKLELSIILPQFLFVLLVIGFASRDKVLEEYAVINNLYVEDEESTETSYADAVNVVITDQLLAIGNLIQTCSILYFKNHILDRIQCFA